MGEGKSFLASSALVNASFLHKEYISEMPKALEQKCEKKVSLGERNKKVNQAKCHLDDELEDDVL